MLNNIIEAITPSNISDINLIKDSMNIFFDYLMKNSDISINIKNMFDQNKIPIYEEFVKIYLNAIYDILSKSEHNEALYSALKTNYEAVGLNINDINLNIDITKLLTEDYILTNKHYKEAKGTPTAMEYIYNIIIDSGVQNDFLKDNLGKFQFKEGKNIFEYSVEGTMIEAIYEHYVKPLTHPVGWAYFYQRIFYLAFTDYFDIKFVYTFAKNGLEVRCMNGDIYSKDNYLTNISHDGKKLVQNNTVKFIDVKYIGADTSATKRTTVYFESGETLISDNNPRSLMLTLNNKILIDYNSYAGNCGLYIKETLKIISTVNDDINFCDTSSIASTAGKINVIGAGNVYVGATTCGDILVNKNVSVTYESYTGVQDGTDYADTFSAGGMDNKNTIPDYWDEFNLKWDNFNYDASSDIKDKTGIYWDKFNLKWDNFDYVALSEINDKIRIYWDEFNLKWDNFNYDASSDIKDKTGIYWDKFNLKWDNFNYDDYTNKFKDYWDEINLKWDNFNYDTLSEIKSEPKYDGPYGILGGANRYKDYFDESKLKWGDFKFDAIGRNDVQHNLGGKIANDTFEIQQELQYCDVNPNTPTLSDGRANHLCNPSFTDELKHNVKWDEFALHWDKFNYDGAYISEDFEIDFDKNTWDTNLYFDNFQFDSKYIGGGSF